MGKSPVKAFSYGSIAFFLLFVVGFVALYNKITKNHFAAPTMFFMLTWIQSNFTKIKWKFWSTKSWNIQFPRVFYLGDSLCYGCIFVHYPWWFWFLTWGSGLPTDLNSMLMKPFIAKIDLWVCKFATSEPVLFWFILSRYDVTILLTSLCFIGQSYFKFN